MWQPQASAVMQVQRPAGRPAGVRLAEVQVVLTLLAVT